MRTFAIGDIHGCLGALQTLLGEIAPRPTDVVVMLGDYVDRGPDSAGVLRRLQALQKHCHLVAIKGNHEELMLNARTIPEQYKVWLHNGGMHTLLSYGGKGTTLADVPTEDWDFLERECRDYYETPTHLFVHANADPELPLDKQSKHMLRWRRFHDARAHRSGKVLVCGHSPHLFPESLGYAICLDTCAYRKDGWLTCLEVKSGKLVQANQKGEVKAGNIGDYFYG